MSENKKPTAYELRYRREDTKQPTVQTNEFIERHLRRKTVRHFDINKKIDPAQLNYLFTCAQAAPSSSGAGSWSAIVLTTPEEKESFREHAGEVLGDVDIFNRLAFQTCSAYIIWVLDNFKLQRGIELVANKKASAKALNFLNSRLKPGAGTAIPDWTNPDQLFDPAKHSEWMDQSYYSFRAMTDCTVAAQTFVMCAESLGIKTMYMGSLAHCNISSFKNQLNLPDRTFPIFGMCVGYETKQGTDHNGVPRQPDILRRFKSNPDWSVKPVMPLSAVVHQGRYNPDIIDQNLLEYNEVLMNYNDAIDPLRGGDYLVVRVTGRVKRVVNHIEQMRAMGNKFL